METEENLWRRKSYRFRKLGFLFSLWLGFGVSAHGQTTASSAGTGAAVAGQTLERIGDEGLTKLRPQICDTAFHCSSRLFDIPLRNVP
jgi:hypothetical protein